MPPAKPAPKPQPRSARKPATKPARASTAKSARSTATGDSSRARPEQPFRGQRWAFFGEFASWPRYHGMSPETVAVTRGATLVSELGRSTKLDVMVIGDRRGAGRAEARKWADARAGQLEVLDEAAYRERVRVDLAGKRFAFAGGFDCSPEGLDAGILPRLVGAVAALIVPSDEPLDYLVVGNRRGPRKIAIVNDVARRIAAGAPTVLLDEADFLDLVRVERPASGLDFPAFIGQLYGDVEHGRMGRALDMLRQDRFSLYAHHDETQLVGVVRSQSRAGTIYAPYLTAEGAYGCAQPSLDECMGLQGTLCKHLLVLVVGLARSGELPLERAARWIHAAAHKSPRDNHALCAEAFLHYKGAEAGELDWRPTETIPEDFYAL